VQGVVRLIIISCHIPGLRQHQKTMGFFNNLISRGAGSDKAGPRPVNELIFVCDIVTRALSRFRVIMSY
jgi:hypothetical protein